ncbi:putative adhesin [Marinibactrum halimedae]|uniref:Putative adhesin Stv domain-containing protein n=1 Tax=Marinibactrum halimedae TaxID=1444977 RepID=A0AA37T6K6_9GAMM|nr:hypothetical protein [Marinibactrum halimedae]MCD9461131.1 hypothetical protein [Marinibactrum halimedae]GLS24641.1 hypothetical protein GCM10007877_03550 [Marinibactrum halimedae]
MPRYGKRSTHLWVRAHGKYYEKDGFISNTQLPGNTIIRFYGPPGYAMSGGLADDMLGKRGPLRKRHMGQCKRHSPYDSRASRFGEIDTVRIRTFTPGLGYSEPKELGFGDGKKIRNYTIIGEDSIDGLPAGIFENRTRGRIGLIKRLGDGQEMTLKQLLDMIQNDEYLQKEEVTVHYIQCRSYSSRNTAPAHSKTNAAKNFKQGYMF